MSSKRLGQGVTLGFTGALIAAMISTTQILSAQAPAPDHSMSRYVGYQTKVFHLANVAQVSEANEIVTTLRNYLVPEDRVYYVQSQNAIVMFGPEGDVILARKLLDELDQPKKTYRLTFTTDELDADKLVGTQHFSMIVVSGGQTITKVGSKVPIVTGSYEATKGAEKQVTYLDVGLNVDASLDESSQGLRLRTKMERTSVAPEERAGLATDDPVIRQAQLEGTANLVPGKPLQLGSLDVPGSTRHVNVSVVAEVVR